MCPLEEQLFQQAKEAINALSLGTNPELRRSAIEWMQGLKTNKSNCQVNVRLALKFVNNGDSNLEGKLFGFQTLEGIINYSWNDLDQSSKAQVKHCIQSLILQNNLGQNVLSNALVKCAVHVIIRDWPQQWPDLFNNLLGSPFNELVLLVIWRLTEDVGVLLYPERSNRRRELLAALNESMSNILLYIGQCLQSPEMKLALTALRALTGILEWSPVDESLCNFLCNIMGHDSWDEVGNESKIVASECICLILNRKFKNSQEKKIILSFFNDSNLPKLSFCLRTILSNADPSNQFSYSSLSLAKYVAAVIVTCGEQLLPILKDNPLPETTINEFLQLVVMIFEHPSHQIHSIPIGLLKDCIKDGISSEVLVSRLFASYPEKLMKKPADDVFVRYEFDTWQDYEQSFYKTRSDLLELLRTAAVNCSENIYEKSCRLLETFILGNDQRWESLTLILDTVFNKLPEPKKFRESALPLAERLLQLKTEDASILSYQLSCISALVVFMAEEQVEYYEVLLRHVFKLLRANGKTEDVKNLRRHAASFFVKLCRFYPEKLKTYFNEIRGQVFPWIENGEISRMEGCTLFEGLILIANCVENPADKKDFLENLVNSNRSFLQINCVPENLMHFIGLTSVESFIERGINRSFLSSLVGTFLALLKRSNDAPHLYHLISPFFAPFVSLVKCLNQLWNADVMKHCWDPETIFAKIAIADRNCLLEGFCVPRSENTLKGEALKCQSYLWSLHESSFSLLTTCLTTFGSGIATTNPQFISIFDELPSLPPMKLRMILKVMVKVLSSKLTDDQVMWPLFFEPLFEHHLPFIFHKVEHLWNSFRSTNWQECEQVEDEIIEEQSNRLLSRELLDLFKIVLVQEKHPTGSDRETETCSRATISSLGQFLLQKDLNRIICMTVTSLSWVDSNVLSKSIQVNQIVVEFLVQHGLISTKEEFSFYIHHLLIALSFMADDDQNQPGVLSLFLSLYEHSKTSSVSFIFPQLTGTDAATWQQVDLSILKLEQGKKSASIERKKREVLKSVLSSITGASLNQMRPEKRCEIKSLEPHIFRHKKRDAHVEVHLQETALCSLFSE